MNSHVDFTASLKTRAGWMSVPGTKCSNLTMFLNERVNKRWPEGFRVFRKSPSLWAFTVRQEPVCAGEDGGLVREPSPTSGRVRWRGPGHSRHAGSDPGAVRVRRRGWIKIPLQHGRRISWVLQWFRLLSLFSPAPWFSPSLHIRTSVSRCTPGRPDGTSLQWDPGTGIFEAQVRSTVLGSPVCAEEKAELLLGPFPGLLIEPLDPGCLTLMLRSAGAVRGPCPSPWLLAQPPLVPCALRKSGHDECLPLGPAVSLGLTGGGLHPQHPRAL